VTPDPVSPEPARAARRARADALAAAWPGEDGDGEVIGLGIASVPIALRVGDAGFADRLRAAFGRFAGPLGPGAVPVAVGLDGRSALWRDGSAEPRVAARGALLLVEHRDFAGVLAADASRMAVRQPRRTLSTENALRVLLALALLRRGGLLLHAAGVVRPPGATILFGRSGSGKSTVARLARGRPLLGDDLVALTPGRDGWIAHATPFGGGAARRRRARSARLGALLRLRHGPELELRRLAPARGVAELLQSTVLPAAGPSDRAAALERCAELATALGVRELRFPIDHGLWRFLRERGV
jgi:hypothetical protein